MPSNLDWFAAVGLVGSIASVAGLAYAFVVGRRTQYRKVLAWEVTHPLPLASVLPDTAEHRLSIVYERQGVPPLNVRGAYVRFLQIGNLGREPIRRSDIALGDPLRIEVSGGSVLDIAVVGTSRPVIEFALGAVEEQQDRVRVPVTFDFLDFKDSAIVSVLTDVTQVAVGVEGTVIGMPQGIVWRRDLQRHPVLNPLGCVLGLVLQITALVGAVWAFRAATGSLRSLWVLLLPILAFVVPGALIILVANFAWPKGPRWPKTPSLPRWFTSRYMRSHDLLFNEPFGAPVSEANPERTEGSSEGSGSRRTTR